MPVVPRIDRPPMMPSRPLSVFAPAPRRRESQISTSTSPARRCCRAASAMASRDHLARHRIDRRLARRQRQARPRHRADALAGAKGDAAAGRAAPHRRDDQRAMRHVGIVAGVLDHAGASPSLRRARRSPAQRRRARRRGSVDLDRIGKLAGEQRRTGRLGRRGGAGAGRPAPAQAAVLLAHASCAIGAASRRRHDGARRADEPRGTRLRRAARRHSGARARACLAGRRRAGRSRPAHARCACRRSRQADVIVHDALVDRARPGARGRAGARSNSPANAAASHRRARPTSPAR